MKWLVACLPVVLFVACAPSTPAHRIAARPAEFSALSEDHRQLVRQGRIDTGMPETGVALAWGSPDRRLDGNDGEIRTSRWDYAGARPVMLQQWGGIYRNRFCGPNPWVFGPEVVFVPYRRASVWFRDGSVARWERMH